jgi:hypothetical protein
MRRALAISLLLLGGCVSGPAPDDLVLPPYRPSPDPLRLSEVVRLSKAGLTEETIVGLIQERGIVEQPGPERTRRLKSAGVSDGVLRTLAATPPAAPPASRPKFVQRDLYLPLWPVYSGGRFRLGIRSSCWVQAAPEPPGVGPAEPLEEPPPVVDP